MYLKQRPVSIKSRKKHSKVNGIDSSLEDAEERCEVGRRRIKATATKEAMCHYERMAFPIYVPDTVDTINAVKYRELELMEFSIQEISLSIRYAEHYNGCTIIGLGFSISTLSSS